MTRDLLQEPGSARITGRAPALRPSVPLYRHMLYGSGLSHPLDFLVLNHIHYMCEDGKTFSVDELVEVLRREGIRSANGKGLIGSKAVYESVARLRTGGWLHRAQENGGNFGSVEYTFYEFPATNPHWTPPKGSDSSENTPLPLSGEAGTTLPVSNRISAGQTASPDKGSADKARADRRTGGQGISAGQTASPDRRSGRPSPPHPPEEVTTSSPNPLTDTSGHRPAAPGEEGEVFDPRETAAAARFLQTLPQPWSIGRVKAKALAPVLLEAMSDQGWPRLAELDGRTRGLLVQQLTKNPTGVRNHGSVLERDRVPNLPLYEVVAGAGTGIPAQGSVGVPGPPPAVDPGYKPVPPPADVAAILAGLRKPTI
ncbi:hypothetical protein ACIGHB_29895 [Streptomyces sp. NPDC085460]|uniref:hypothetical protein n=1 Tax=Streptomyces sp. NPDC085460 TaxID=3365723 RepID=UPI0037D95160